MNVAGVHLSWQMLLAAIVGAQWLIVAVIAFFAPIRMKTAMAMSTVVLAAGWLFAFNARSILASKTDTAEASAVGVTKHQGSCASIANDMSGDEVRKKLGTPDEVRNDEVIRGPGSSTLIYRDLRCAVHLFDDKVELVD